VSNSQQAAAQLVAPVHVNIPFAFVAGKATRNTVPLPTSLATVIRPPSWSSG